MQKDLSLWATASIIPYSYFMIRINRITLLAICKDSQYFNSNLFVIYLQPLDNYFQSLDNKLMLSVSGLLLASDGIINLRPGRAGPAQEAAGIDIVDLIPSAVNAIFVVAVVIFFFMLVIGGIRWISSGGDKTQTESAKNQITASIIGLVLVLSAYAIVNLIGLFFGFDVFEPGFLDISPI